MTGGAEYPKRCIQTTCGVSERHTDRQTHTHKQVKEREKAAMYEKREGGRKGGIRGILYIYRAE